MGNEIAGDEKSTLPGMDLNHQPPDHKVVQFMTQERLFNEKLFILGNARFHYEKFYLDNIYRISRLELTWNYDFQ